MENLLALARQYVKDKGEGTKDLLGGVGQGAASLYTPYLNLLKAGTQQTLGAGLTGLSTVDPLPDSWQRALSRAAIKASEDALRTRQQQGLQGSGATEGGLNTALRGAGATGKALLSTYGLLGGAGLGSTLGKGAIASVPNLAATAGISGGLTYGLGKARQAAGGEPITAREVGQTIGRSPSYAAINAIGSKVFSDPVMGSLPNFKDAPLLQRALLRGSVYGSGNVLEDLLLTYPFQENRKPTFNELATSFGTGFIFGAGAEGIKEYNAARKSLPETKNKHYETQLRKANGEWMETGTLKKPDGVSKAQWESMQKINKALGRDPYTPVYQSDLKKAIKQSVEDRIGNQAKPTSDILEAQKIKSAQGELYDVNSLQNPVLEKLGIKNYDDVRALQEEMPRKFSNTKVLEELGYLERAGKSKIGTQKWKVKGDLSPSTSETFSVSRAARKLKEDLPKLFKQDVPKATSANITQKPIRVFRAGNINMDEAIKGTGVYTTPQQSYAAAYLFDGNKLQTMEIPKGTKVYEADDIETLHMKLYGKPVPEAKSGLHDDWIDNLRKAETKIAKKLKNLGYDVIHFNRDRYDFGYADKMGKPAESYVILKKLTNK